MGCGNTAYTDMIFSTEKRLTMRICPQKVHRRNLPVPPLFGLRDTVPLTFQDKKVNNLLSPAVKRSNLRRIKYNKTIFDRGSAPDPAGTAHDDLPDPRVRWGGRYFLPNLLSSRLGTQGRLVLLLNWYPPLFSLKLRPYHNLPLIVIEAQLKL